MKFLVLSDLHANNSVLDKMDSLFSEADGVIFAGDFAECFKPETGKAALEALCTKHDSIFAVLGNCDEAEFIEELEEYSKSLSQLEKEIVESESVGHSGVWRKKLTHALSKQGYDLVQARHAALWDDLIGRMMVVARPVVQSYAKEVSKATDHQQYCNIYNYYSKKINKGGELYKLLLKNGFSKDDIDHYRYEYIKELERY